MATIVQPKPVPASSPVIEIKLTSDVFEAVMQEISASLVRRQTNVDHEGLAMADIGALAWEKYLPEESFEMLRSAPEKSAAVIHISSPPGTTLEAPATPVSGFMSDALVQHLDTALLGAMLITGQIPASFAFENDGRLFRNVVANPAAKLMMSSHGSSEPLGWHTDTPVGRFERRSRPYTSDTIIPRFLNFFDIRNRDAHGNPVSTDVLLLEPVLRKCKLEAVRILQRNQYQVNPPQSCSCSPLKGVALIEFVDELMCFRYNANPSQVFGLTEGAKWAIKEFAAALESSADDLLPFPLTPGSILLFDNYRVAHARRSFDAGANLAESRWLRRCYGVLSACGGKHIDRASWPFVIA